MIRFSQTARQQTAVLRAAIQALPFNQELAAGTLAREPFQHYITQDALYLGEFSRALALAAARAPDTSTLQAFAQSALGAVAVERVLHEHYLHAFGVDPASLASTEPAPDCLAYTNFLLATAYHEPWEVLVAALLPCFWIYWDVGCAIAATAAVDNPYRAWIDTYADPSFGAAVQTILATADSAADSAGDALRRRMLAAFIRAAQYEWLFWDGAYHRRGWPPAA
ncbi:MAG TPA: TenA family protein [Stellaceae bacterium]|nr:TenA family protein [Stellaceae bacterium]